jgi:hypothetical protein
MDLTDTFRRKPDQTLAARVSADSGQKRHTTFADRHVWRRRFYA